MKRGLRRWAAAGLGVLAATLLWGPARACINLYSANLKGEQVEVNEKDFSSYARRLSEHHHNPAEWTQKRAALEKDLLAKPNDFQLRADIAATHVFTGEPKEAVAALEELEAERPGEYVVAGNLGTAYELDGQNAKALEWIKKGIERNADSHEGTEWLHVMILEAKGALENDPAWLDTHSVLGMDFGTKAKPVIPSAGPVDHLGKTRSFDETVKALEYQLHERTAFVKPPDPVVADLFHALACLVAETKSVSHAEGVMAVALKYHEKPGALMLERNAFFAASAEAATGETKKKGGFSSGTWNAWIALTVGAAVSVAVILFLIVRRSRSQTY